MKYDVLTLAPQDNTLIYQDIKQYHVYDYPRRNTADAVLLKYQPSVISCTLIVYGHEEYMALKNYDRQHSEKNLYIDKFGLDSSYYKRVILELGQEKQVDSDTWIIPAVFTALDPFLYDAETGEVIY
jgi:hypothetical protein